MLAEIIHVFFLLCLRICLILQLHSGSYITQFIEFIPGMKKVHPKYYDEYKDSFFGHQTVKELQLCAMMRPKDVLGYYHVEHRIPIGWYGSLFIFIQRSLFLANKFLPYMPWPV